MFDKFNKFYEQIITETSDQTASEAENKENVKKEENKEDVKEEKEDQNQFSTVNKILKDAVNNDLITAEQSKQFNDMYVQLTFLCDYLDISSIKKVKKVTTQDKFAIWVELVNGKKLCLCQRNRAIPLVWTVG